MYSNFFIANFKKNNTHLIKYFRSRDSAVLWLLRHYREELNPEINISGVLTSLDTNNKYEYNFVAKNNATITYQSWIESHKLEE